MATSAGCTAAGHWATRAPPAARPAPTCPELYSRLSAYVRTAQKRASLCCSDPVQQQLLANLSYVSCDGTAPLSVSRVLSGGLRVPRDGLTIAMIGDSTMSQLYEAVLFALYDASVPIRLVTRSGSENRLPKLYARDAACSMLPGRFPPAGGSELWLDLRRGRPCEPSHYARHSSHWDECALLPTSEMHIGEGGDGAAGGAGGAGAVGGAAAERVTLEFWRFDTAEKGARECGGGGAAQFAQRVGAAASRADIVFANVGVHYNDRVASAGLYERALGTLFSTLINGTVTHSPGGGGVHGGRRARRRGRGAAGAHRYFVESFPQHFRTPSGSGTWGDHVASEKRKPARLRCPGTCVAVTRRDWRNELAEAVAARYGLAESIVRISDVLRPLHVLHKPASRRRCAGQDCTHYCYDAALWEAVLDPLLRRVVVAAAQLAAADRTRPASLLAGQRARRNAHTHTAATRASSSARATAPPRTKPR